MEGEDDLSSSSSSSSVEINQRVTYTRMEDSPKLNHLLGREEDWYIIGTGEFRAGRTWGSE